MPSHFSLRMQFGPHQDPADVTDQLLRLVNEAPVDEVMFFYFGEEQNDGHETLERLQDWIDRSRPYRAALKRAGVAVSLNPWHSVLHCDRGRRLKPGQDWQQMVDPQGAQAQAVVCPLDPDWRAYFLETLRMYAQEDFRVVWIDDDIRFHNHGELHWGGCFCPLHIAEFNLRAGTRANREEIVNACLRPGAPHPWRAIWMDMWEETTLDLLQACRKELEPGGAKMGLMSSMMAAHGAEGRRWDAWWDVTGGGQAPVHRPHFWGYTDGTSSHLPGAILALDHNRALQPAGTETGPEIENHPYGPWNKSYRQNFAQMALAHVLGSTHLNISLYDFMGNRPDDDPERAAFLTRVRPNLDWLADHFPMNLISVGVGIPWAEDAGRNIRTGEGTSWHELHCPSQGWSSWLGAAGIAFSGRAQSSVNSLAGPMAWCVDDAMIEAWLAAGLLLDGDAAAILSERGFGAKIGVKSHRWITQDDIVYSAEQCRHEAFSLRVGAQMSVNFNIQARRMFQAELDPGAEVISDLTGPLQNVVGHGTFTFRNECGGRVAVVPWGASLGARPVMDIYRAAQLKRLADWLTGEETCGGVEGGAWLVPQFLRDGASWAGAVWNAGCDEVNSFRLRRPTGMPPVGEAWHLTPAGERLAVDVQEDLFTFDRPLCQWEPVVF